MKFLKTGFFVAIMLMCVTVLACPLGTEEEDAEGAEDVAVTAKYSMNTTKTDSLELLGEAQQASISCNLIYAVYLNCVGRDNQEEVDEVRSNGNDEILFGVTHYNDGYDSEVLGNSNFSSGDTAMSESEWCDAFDWYEGAEDWYIDADDEFASAGDHWGDALFNYEFAETLMCIDCDFPEICGEGEA